MINFLKILIPLSIFLLIQSETVEEKFYLKLEKSNHESEAVRILNEYIYQGLTTSNHNALRLMFSRKWMKATRQILDFLTDTTTQTAKSEINKLSEYIENHLLETKLLLKNKKKNIAKLSPVFEWSQDNDLIKIRLKFSKNLESPGEKDIQGFKVVCKRSHLVVEGYKVHEDYVAYYYRDLHLYDFIKTHSCNFYKETDGTYIIKFEKNQATLYWNHLNQINDDHSNMYTWFDVFTTFDNKAKYTEFREWTKENLLISDIDDYVRDNTEDKQNRVKKMMSNVNYLKTKDFENKNYCNSPINEKFCLLDSIYDWNYWLS